MSGVIQTVYMLGALCVVCSVAAWAVSAEPHTLRELGVMFLICGAVVAAAGAAVALIIAVGYAIGVFP